MAKKKNLDEKADRRRRARVWCGEYQVDKPTRKAYRYVSYNSRVKEDLALQTQLAMERWGTGIYAHLRKIPAASPVVMPIVEGQPVITMDSQGQKNTSFGEFAWEWYNEQIGPTALSESSKDSSRVWINAHLVPKFGMRMIRDITVTELQNFLFELAGQSYSMVSKIMMTIKKVFEFAESKKLVEHEILGQLRTLKMPKTTQGERRALTEEEQRVMLVLGKSNIEGLILLILFWLGLRRGEALALRWSDIDFRNRTVYIKNDLDFKAKSADKLGELKTEAAYRYVPIFDELLVTLERVKPPEAILETEIRNGSDFLFKGKRSGTHLSESTFKRMWERLMKAAYEMDPTIETEVIVTGSNQGNLCSILTPHYFRHNYATMMCDMGVSEAECIAYMGHEDSKMIREIYAHRTKKAQAQSAAKFRQGAKEHLEYLLGAK